MNANRLDKRIVEEDNVVFAVAEPAALSDPRRALAALPRSARRPRSAPTPRARRGARRCSPSPRAPGGAFWGDEEVAIPAACSRTRMIADMDLRRDPAGELLDTCTTSTAGRATSSATGRRSPTGTGTWSSLGTTSAASSKRPCRRSTPRSSTSRVADLGTAARERRRRRRAHHLRPAAPLRGVHGRRALSDDALQLAPPGVSPTASEALASRRAETAAPRALCW